MIAIENVRLFQAQQQRTYELAEALEQQTATSEVLKVISTSSGELIRVFEAMLQNALQICEAKFGMLDRTFLDNKLIDEYHLWIMPTRVGQGKRAFADIEAGTLDLELLRTHRFANGAVALTYRPH